jgi:stearoyl-CoA desaturase (delta-9 desaturase)
MKNTAYQSSVTTLKPHIWKIIIPQHLFLLLGIASVFLGYTSAWALLLIPLGYLVFGYLGFTIFMHRYWSHRSFETYPWIAYLGAYLGLLCGNGTPIAVEAIHMRLHHAHSDQELDPHTPAKGRLWSWLVWHNMTHVWPKLNPKLLKDPILKFMHRNYFKIWWGTFILLTLINWHLSVFFMIGGGVYHFHLEGLVNTFAHSGTNYGYTNGDTGDNSVNINSKLLMFLSLGNSLHHNHHLQPWNYTFAIKPGEFDLAKYIVPLIMRR